MHLALLVKDFEPKDTLLLLIILGARYAAQGSLIIINPGGKNDVDAVRNTGAPNCYRSS